MTCKHEIIRLKHYIDGEHYECVDCGAVFELKRYSIDVWGRRIGEDEQ